MRSRPRQEWSIYLRNLSVSLVLVGIAVAIQTQYVYSKTFEFTFLLVPSGVALVVGALLGRLAVLRARLRQKNREFRAVVDIAQEFTYLRTIEGRYEYVSPSCERLTGYPQQAFYEKDNLMDQLIHPDDRQRWNHHVHQINARGMPESFDIRLLTKSGEVVWMTHICGPVYNDSGEQTGVRSTNLDITQRKRDQVRIERMAHFDPLTDLPNRRLLEQDISRRVGEKQRFAVLFLDLSRFKNINDSLGHSFGDRLLQRIAQRVEDVCPEDALLCRFGGDEFIVVHPGIDSNEKAVGFSRQLLEAIESPLVIDRSELHISGNVGIAFCPEDGTDTESLVRNADAAMYRAKRSGQGKIAEYHAHYSAEAAQFVSVESAIHHALKHAEIVPFYQSKVELGSGRIVGLEALARWQHPVRGLVPPCEFIDIAEETGQVAEIGRQMLNRVLEDMVRWRNLGFEVPVALNISPRQFSDRDFSDKLLRAVEQSGCAPSLVELEVTEQVFLDDVGATGERLKWLREKGFRIALDDFGTGYSSFNYLRGLPIDTIKLDRAFVSDVERERVSQAILRALIGICSELDFSLVSEGIETETQRKLLLRYGCRLGQGFLFDRPQRAEAVERRMMAGQAQPIS